MTRVAIAHDYLTQRGGAERLLLEIAAAFPGAAIHTTLYEPKGTFEEFARMDIRASSLNRVPLFRRSHRLAFPLLAAASNSVHVDTDVLVCSSTGWAHGFRTTGKKLVYCNTPAKWIHDLERYASGQRTAAFVVGSLLRPYLTRWDRQAAASAHRYVASSTAVRDRIRAAYGIEAEILHPPVLIETTGPERPLPGVDPGFFLVASRLLPYKNVHAVVEAFKGLPERLVVVGGGPMLADLQASAPPNVHVTGEVHEDTLRWAYRSAVGVVTAAWEDFGLVPIEAAAHGLPVAALAWGGHLDTVLDGETGVLFSEPSPTAIADAVGRMLAMHVDVDRLQEHIRGFSAETFKEELRRHVAELADGS